MAKIEPKRVRMTDEQVKAFLKHYATAHDLRGKELEEALHRCAATRWAALERYAKRAQKPKPAKKAAHKKTAHKKAA